MRQNADQQVTEIPHADETAPVANAPERKRPPAVHPAHEAKEIGCHTRPVHEWWTYDRGFHAGSRSNLLQKSLREALRQAVGISRTWLIIGGVRAAVLFAVDLDAAQVDKSSDLGLRRSFR